MPLIILFLAFATLALGQPANTFFSTFDAERGNTFAPARDGNIWLGGVKDERVLLVKMTTGGHVLDKHSLDFKGSGFDSESLVEVFEDSDGSIVGCGNFETDNLGRGFAFRYNPSSRTVLWAHIVRSESYNTLYGITPIGPNGDYLLYGSPQVANIDDAELLRLDRATGQTKSAQRFGLKGPDQLNRIIYHTGALYGCGRFSNGLGFNFNSNTRHALCKLDTATLKPLWTRIGPLPSSKEAQLQGRDVIMENNALISTFSGNATGVELTQSTIFLQKTDLNGKLLWVKQYNLPEWNGEFAETVVSVPDGYFLFGQDLLSDTSRLFLLKTDKQGNPLRAVKIDFDVNDELSQTAPRAAILPISSGLFFAATSQNTSGQFQALLGKTDFDGRLEGNCGFLKSTPVNLQPLPNPVSELVVPEFSSGNTQLSPILPALENPDLTFAKKCSPVGTCPNLPDLRLRMDSIRCTNGEARLYYSFCNTGAQEYTGSAFFGLYDKNPFKEEARLITTIIHTGNKLLPGDCVRGSVSSSFAPPDVFKLDTFKHLYAVMGINQNTKTPIKISDFPFAPNRAECGYFNNLDSLEVPDPLCKKRKNQPDITLRVNRTFCSADSTLFFTANVCNLGDSIVSGPISFAFYDKNPLKEKVNAVWSTTISQTLAPGECTEHTLPLPAVVLPFPKLFSFMGAGSNTPTPISLTDFPLPQSPVESDYLNNLDSFVVKTPECSDCERPTTFIKSIGVANKEERLQSMCLATDGHVYMIGRQNDNGIITKISPNGDILWVRNFKPPGQTFGNLDFVQVLEDSEGYLLITGTANHSVNAREAMAMRYDVNANTILWYQHYPALNPEILGVLEKPSGGNFVLFGYSDELFGSGFFTYYKTRSHIWEISRASGEVVPALSTIFNGDPSTYLNDLVLHNGHFYGVGGWANRDIPNSSRGMLMKLSASDGALEWMQGILADTTNNIRFFQPSRILVDDEQLVVLGAAIQDFNLPTQQTFIYLSKYDLEGKLLWIKRYASNIRPVEMISVPDGYAVLGYGFQQGSVAKWQIHKLSKNGEVIAAKEFNGPSGSSGAGQFFNQSQLVQLPNYLLMGNQFNAGTFTDMILVKTDLDLQIADSCGLVRDLNISPQNVSATTNPLFSPSEPYLVEAIKQTTTLSSDSLVINPLCPVCPCTDKPDIAIKSIEVLCTLNGGAKVNFQVCNQGFVSAPQGFDLTFYDKNPLTEAATPLFSLNVEAKPGFADCVPFSVDLDANLLTFKKLYAMAGVWNDVATPLLLKEFPYADAFEECDYANNLDSVDLKFEGPNLNDLGPVRSICSGQSTVLDAGPGFVAYQWSTGASTQSISAGADGLYIVEATDQCGKKVRDSVLVKTLPTYSILRDLKLAQGDSISIGGKIYKGTATVVINPKTVTGCDSTITYRIWPDTLFCKDRSESFFQVSYIKGTNSLGRIVVPAADGSIYLAGDYSYTKSEEYIVDTLLLVKTSANGQVLWSRGLDFTPNSIIFRMIEDSEGNLVGLMRNLPTPKNKPIITAFRYNPSTNQLLWVTNILTAPAPFQFTHMIAERGSGGNFVVVSENEFDNITQVYQLDRNTGALIGNECWRYNSFSKVYSGGIIQQDVLILEGIDSSPLTPNSPLPNVELRINLNTGQPIEPFEWVNPSQNFFTCRAQVVDNEGNTASQLDVRHKGAREDTAIWIRKTSAKGELLWAKKFDIKEKDVIETLHLGIVALSDGYVCAAYLLGLNGMNKGVGLIKVSKNGELQWAKKMADLKYPSIYWALSPQVIAARQDTVFLTGAHTNNDLKNTVEKGMLLAKINKNGEIGNSCDLMVDMNVIVSNPTFFKRKAEVPFSTIPLNFVSAPKGNIKAKSMQFYTDCSKCLPASSNLDITCPNDLTVTLPPNTSSTVVDYNLPTAKTDCPDPKITLKVIQGPGVNDKFPIGVNTVCYEASNTCGAKDTCCFKVAVVNPETPCDFKTGLNCMRYELLSVKFNAQGQRRYRVRLSNTCTSPVQFVYIQSPNGVNAVAPAGGSVYTTVPAGRAYEVRNPNASPFASIRFKAQTGGLKGGASDIFEYTLPQQSAPVYILVAVRLENGEYYETYLNTFNCPAQPYDGNRNRENEPKQEPEQTMYSFSVFPNPTNGLLYVNFPAEWEAGVPAERGVMDGKDIKLLIVNALGQIVFQQDYAPDDSNGRQISITLDRGLSNGMYLVSVIWPDGKRQSERFVLER